MQTKHTLIAAVLLVMAVVIGGNILFADTYTPGPDTDKYDTCVAVTLADAVGTQTWNNVRGWTRLISVGVALTNELVASTNTISVVRSEGVTEALAVIEGDASSFRWSALNRNDVILRDGDAIRIEMTETNSGGGTIYLNMDL